MDEQDIDIPERIHASYYQPTATERKMAAGLLTSVVFPLVLRLF